MNKDIVTVNEKSKISINEKFSLKSDSIVENQTVMRQN